MTPAAPIGIGTSIVLITVGAILRYAIDADDNQILFLKIDVAGTILLLIGILTLVLSIVYTMVMTNRARAAREPDVVREREYYDDPTRRRDRY